MRLGLFRRHRSTRGSQVGFVELSLQSALGAYIVVAQSLRRATDWWLAALAHRVWSGPEWREFRFDHIIYTGNTFGNERITGYQFVFYDFYKKCCESDETQRGTRPSWC